MTAPRVLYIGLEPSLVDFSAMPGMTADKVSAGIETEMGRLKEAGYDARWFPVDRGETAASVLAAELDATEYACVAIGAGLRTHPDHFILFEALVNVVHDRAPRAKLCFNTKPTDTLDAVRRWVPNGG